MLASAPPVQPLADGYTVGVAIGSALPVLLGIVLLVLGLLARHRSAPAAGQPWPGAAPTPWPPAQPGQPEQPGWGAPTGQPAPPGQPAQPGLGAPTGGPGTQLPGGQAPEPGSQAAGSGDPPEGPGPAGQAPPTWPGAVPGGPVAAPRRRGTALIVVGAVLIALGVLGNVARAVTSVTAKREVALPPSVLGLQRDEQVSQQLRQQFLASAPKGLTHSEVALYGMPPEGLIVVAGSGTLGPPAREIEGFRNGLASTSGVTLNDRTEVAAGPLGGKASCWAASFQGTPAGVCVFADRGSLLATIDFAATMPRPAGARAGQTRAAAVRKAA